MMLSVNQILEKACSTS